MTLNLLKKSYNRISSDIEATYNDQITTVTEHYFEFIKNYVHSCGCDDDKDHVLKAIDYEMRKISRLLNVSYPSEISEKKTVNLIKISQIDAKDMYIGKIYYKDIKDNVILTKCAGSNGKLFQRDTDKKRVNDIAEYLAELEEASKTDLIPVIPFATPLILSFATANKEDYEKDKAKYLQSENALPILDNDSKLILPEKSNFQILIVDGQHRFRGVESFLKSSETNEDFEFFATFLFDYDLYEQSQVFANK